MTVSLKVSAVTVVLIAGFVCIKAGTIPDNWRDYLPANAGNDTQPFMNSAYQQTQAVAENLQRTANKDPNRRWANRTVPYVLSKEFTAAQIAIIEKGHRTIENGSCIRFVNRTNEYDYVEYINGRGCYSVGVGRQGGRQVLSLAIPGCVTLPVVVHESLHAIGFHHEQSRSDRDDNVIINYDNINKQDYPQFQKEETNNLNTPYDIDSIMHYGAFDFAVNRSIPSIVPKKMGTSIGQRDRMTPIDKERVNRFYQCGGPNYTIDTSADLTPGCSGYFQLVAGDTCERTATNCGISLAQLYAFNPKLGPDNAASCKKIAAGNRLCCNVPAATPAPPTEPPSTGTPSPGCQGWWQLRAGDTCDKVATICGIPAAAMYALNPFLANGANCSDLKPHVGKMVCCKNSNAAIAPTTPLAPKLSTLPPTAQTTTEPPTCQESTTQPPLFEVEKDCLGLWVTDSNSFGEKACKDSTWVCGKTQEQIYAVNPFLQNGKNCASIQPGQKICCRRTADDNNNNVAPVNPSSDSEIDRQTTRSPVPRPDGCNGFWTSDKNSFGEKACKDSTWVCGITQEKVYELNPYLKGGKGCADVKPGDAICCRKDVAKSNTGSGNPVGPILSGGP